MSTSMSHATLLITTKTLQNDKIQHITGFSKIENNPDIMWINKEGEGIGINDIRILKKEVMTSPYTENRRVVLLNQIHQATPQAQNAMLKMLEEPPSRTQFILITNYPHQLLPTIRSRCTFLQSYDYKVSTLDEGSTAPDLEKTKEDDISLPIHLSISESIKQAEQYKDRNKAKKFVLKLIEQHAERVEESPNLNDIHNLKTLQKTLAMLNANVNTQLALEWGLFRLKFVAQ